MPYTVIIVEDEDLIRNEIEHCTPWEQLGLQVIATAADGPSGAKLINLHNPDIVITDIRIPGRDGLEMLKSCSVDHAIILSGHSDFNYMRSAIKLGVFDYLLKPFDDEELIQALASLVEKLVSEEKEMASLGNHRSESWMIDLPEHVGNHLVDSAISMVTQRFAECIGLREIADSLCLSESHLSRLFKDQTGINFLQYLQAYRVNRSIELLHDPSMNISMICHRCGFPSPGYFSKIFRRFIGSSPSQFRDSNPNH